MFVVTFTWGLQLIMRTQDTQLAEVGATIGTLKTMGAAIGDELEDQNR